MGGSAGHLGAPPSSPAEAPAQLRVAGGACAVEQSPPGSYDPALLSLPGASPAPVPPANARGKGGQAK
eukprot:9492419-Pyramimonas_sp.AAC.1